VGRGKEQIGDRQGRRDAIRDAPARETEDWDGAEPEERRLQNQERLGVGVQGIKGQEEERRKLGVVLQLLPVLHDPERRAPHGMALELVVEEVVVEPEIETERAEAAVVPDGEEAHVHGVAQRARQHDQPREPASPR